MTANVIQQPESVIVKRKPAKQDVTRPQRPVDKTCAQMWNSGCSNYYILLYNKNTIIDTMLIIKVRFYIAGGGDL